MKPAGTPASALMRAGAQEAIQRARKHMADAREQPGAFVPDLAMESYARHVNDRTRHFFQTIVKVASKVRNKGGNVTPALFTNHAAAQVQKGQYHKTPVAVKGENQWDAAHLMNTTLVATEYAKQTGQKHDDEEVLGLLMATAATVNQFKTANITADKVIDAEQTTIKNRMLNDLASGTKLDSAFIEKWLSRYLAELKAELTAKAAAPVPGEQIKNDSYATALAAVVKQEENLGQLLNTILTELGV